MTAHVILLHQVGQDPYAGALRIQLQIPPPDSGGGDPPAQLPAGRRTGEWQYGAESRTKLLVLPPYV